MTAVAVERVAVHGLRAERANRRRRLGAADERRRVMARRRQGGQELLADGAGGAGHEDPHAPLTNGQRRM